MSGVQTTFGGVCGAKKGGLALHFGLESADFAFDKDGNVKSFFSKGGKPLKQASEQNWLCEFPLKKKSYVFLKVNVTVSTALSMSITLLIQRWVCNCLFAGASYKLSNIIFIVLKLNSASFSVSPTASSAFCQYTSLSFSSEMTLKTGCKVGGFKSEVQR